MISMPELNMYVSLEKWCNKYENRPSKKHQIEDNIQVAFQDLNIAYQNFRCKIDRLAHTQMYLCVKRNMLEFKY